MSAVETVREVKEDRQPLLKGMARQFGAPALIRLVEDQRDKIAEDMRKGKTFEEGQLDVNRTMLGVYAGWLKEAGIEYPTDVAITPALLEGEDPPTMAIEAQLPQTETREPELIAA